MASSAEEWRKAREQGFPTTFPSGLEADIRPVEVDFFVLHGEIPDILAPLINEIIGGKPYKIDLPPMEELVKKKEWIKFLNDLCRFAFIKPRVVEKAEDEKLESDEISAKDVPFVDKHWLFLKFANPSSRIKTFRPEQAKSLEAVDSGSNHGYSSVPNPAN